MARSIRISEKNAQRLADYMGSDSRDPLAWPEREALEELQRALDRKPPSGLRQAGRKAKKRRSPVGDLQRREDAARREKVAKREERGEIRDRCVSRSEGRCENPDCRRSATELYPAHWDHFFGRARAESVETSWMLCPDCDHLKTHSDPDAAAWYRRFLRHLADQPPTRAYRAARRRAEKRLAFVETRAALPAAPRSTP